MVFDQKDRLFWCKIKDIWRYPCGKVSFPSKNISRFQIVGLCVAGWKGLDIHLTCEWCYPGGNGVEKLGQRYKLGFEKFLRHKWVMGYVSSHSVTCFQLKVSHLSYNDKQAATVVK